MNQILKKIKIENVSEKEAMGFISKGMVKLESATVEQLKASLVGLAETFVATTTECSEQTTFALVMEIVAKTLDNNQEDLLEVMPISGQTN